MKSAEYSPDHWVGEKLGSKDQTFIGGILPTANALIGRSVSRENRGTIYGLTSSATFLGNSLGPLIGGGIAAGFGIRWVFVVTALLLLGNLVWVWCSVAELVSSRADVAGS